LKTGHWPLKAAFWLFATFALPPNSGQTRLRLDCPLSATSRHRSDTASRDQLRDLRRIGGHGGRVSALTILTVLRLAFTLVVWGIGTVDAIQAIDPDQFSHALDKDTNIARSAGADVVLINAQYSPRTESMIALGTYAEDIRWVALQQEVPVFDRFSIMKLWVDLGTFDLYSATKKLDIAERIHTCIGRLLADFMIEAVKPSAPHAKGGR
jgi:hypothetical protein